MTMLGWFLSRSTVRRMRSTNASSQRGSSLGLPRQPEHEEAVRLEVALVDHVEPQLVAQLEEARVRRVVGRADRVDVVRLHQQHVAPHHVLRDRAAVVGIELVTVDAAEQDAPTVDLQQAVLDHDGAEADAQPHALARARDLGVVEARDLRAPRLDRSLRGLSRRDVDAELGHRDPRGHVRVHPQRARAARVVVAGVHEDVVERVRGTGQQRDAAEDPRQPPHVLVLEVGPRRPLLHPHREDVLPTRAQELGDVELARQTAARAHSQLGTVEPDPQAGVDALEAQDRIRPIPLARHREAAPVVTRRVLVGDVRGLHRERVDHVRVGRRAVSVQLPVRRHGQPVPARVVELLGSEVQRRVRAVREPERPVAVQRQRRGVRPQECTGPPQPFTPPVPSPLCQ